MKKIIQSCLSLGFLVNGTLLCMCMMMYLASQFSSPGRTVEGLVDPLLRLAELPIGQLALIANLLLEFVAVASLASDRILARIMNTIEAVIRVYRAESDLKTPKPRLTRASLVQYLVTFLFRLTKSTLQYEV